MIHDAVLEHERAHARSLARVRGHIGSSHGRDVRDWPLVATRSPLSYCLPCERLTRRRLAPVVVFNASVSLLVLGEPDVEVEVKVAGERRRPRKRPAHPPLVRL